MKRIILLFVVNVLLAVGCVPTTIAVNNISQDNLPNIASPLNPKRDYIIYVSWKSDWNEIWAINPESGDKLLVAKGRGLSSGGWSPSGKYWLFEDKDSLYVAKANGSNIQRVYQYQATKDCGFSALWLSDDVILTDVYGCDSRNRIWPPPHQYYTNIKNGKNGRLDPVNEDDEYGTYLIQGIIPYKENWIQANWFTGEIEVADLKGSHAKILDGYTERFLVGSLSMEFVPKTDSVIFFASRKDANDANNASDGLWKMSISNKSPELIIKENPDHPFGEYHISPNGKFLAYTYAKGSKFIAAIYNLQVGKVEHEWDFPYHLSTPTFIWSPDSRYIALPYSKYDYGTSDATSFGVQIMDISNGSTRLLVDENVGMLAWYRIAR